MLFDETYFKSLNYTNYLEREIRYKKMAQELAEYLCWKDKLRHFCKLLDFGCAVGFFAKGLNELGFSCDGYDISDWAQIEAKKRGINVVSFEPSQYDVMFAFDVFEHMSDDEITAALDVFSPKFLLFRIPCSTDGGKTFHLEISKRDPTHINCKTKTQWVDFLGKHGFGHFEPIDLYTIYDTDGVMCYICQKE